MTHPPLAVTHPPLAVTHPPLAVVELPEVLHALSDPLRLDIVRCLARDGECACGSFGVSVSKSTLSTT